MEPVEVHFGEAKVDAFGRLEAVIYLHTISDSPGETVPELKQIFKCYNLPAEVLKDFVNRWDLEFKKELENLPVEKFSLCKFALKEYELKLVSTRELNPETDCHNYFFH